MNVLWTLIFASCRILLLLKGDDLFPPLQHTFFTAQSSWMVWSWSWSQSSVLLLCFFLAVLPTYSNRQLFKVMLFILFLIVMWKKMCKSFYTCSFLATDNKTVLSVCSLLLNNTEEYSTQLFKIFNKFILIIILSSVSHNIYNSLELFWHFIYFYSFQNKIISCSSVFLCFLCSPYWKISRRVKWH